MPNTTINSIQSFDSNSLGTPVVRTLGATSAQGFAQVLQVFTVDSKSELSKDAPKPEHAPADDPVQEDQTQVNQEDQVVESNEDSETVSESESTQEPAAHQQVDTGGETDDGPQQDPNTDQPSETGTKVDSGSVPVNDTGIDQSQGTVREDSTFRLLENQGDQAKLSIKGLGQALSHAADIDLAAIANNLKLGQQPDGSVAKSGQNQSGPHVSQPTQPQAPTQPLQPQTIEAEFVENQPKKIQEPVIVQQSVPIDAKQDQSEGDVQNARSRRVDVVANRAHPPVPTVQQSSSSLTQSQTANSAVGAASSMRSQTSRIVPGNDTTASNGSIGNQTNERQTGSLVEKMNQTQLPSETKRASVLAQVQRGLASLLRSGKNEMTLKLTPGHLGEIKIRMKTDGNRMLVKFETTSIEATEHLNKSVNELTSSLRSKGLNLEQVDIEQADTHSKSLSESTQGQVGDQASREHHSQQQRHSPQDDTHTPADDNDEHQEPESIWTQLGLDAIA